MLTDVPNEQHGRTGVRGQSSATSFRRLNRWQALLVVVLVAATIEAGLAATREPVPPVSGTDSDDLSLYAQVVQRVHSGEEYYDALGGELRTRGYPTSSVFNWRTPLHLVLIARLPSPIWAQALLLIGAACAVGLAVIATCRAGQYALAGVQSVMMCLPLGIAILPHPFFYAEVWSGTVIAISVGCYALGWRLAGASAGLLALFFRELALPFVAVSIVVAYREKRRSELIVWLAGLAGYAVYLGIHAAAVMSRIPPSSVFNAVGHWIQFGGWRFLLMTSRMGLLLGFPFKVMAFYLPLALLGLVGWDWPLAHRVILTVGAYLLAFSILGAPMNFYWGAEYSPLLAFGTTWALPACRDLVYRLFEKAPVRGNTDS